VNEKMSDEENEIFEFIAIFAFSTLRLCVKKSLNEIKMKQSVKIRRIRQIRVSPAGFSLQLLV